MCVLGCIGFLHDRCYKNKDLRESKGDNHEEFHYENGIAACDDEDFVPKYVDDVVGFYMFTRV